MRDESSLIPIGILSFVDEIFCVKLWCIHWWLSTTTYTPECHFCKPMDYLHSRQHRDSYPLRASARIITTNLPISLAKENHHNMTWIMLPSSLCRTSWHFHYMTTDNGQNQTKMNVIITITNERRKKILMWIVFVLATLNANHRIRGKRKDEWE